ncbi:MAG: sulfurtransferase TusA family protein [Chloroflexi bacterium]|nr:sulfurtransferase TusA family protein [Chloroflexota bacterium]
MVSWHADKRIDIRGLVCPYTLIRTKDALKGMGDGQVLEVQCDHEPVARTTIPAFCRQKGYSCQVIEAEGKEWRVLITRKD